MSVEVHRLGRGPGTDPPSTWLNPLRDGQWSSWW